jgi:hypothetical protein
MLKEWFDLLSETIVYVVDSVQNLSDNMSLSSSSVIQVNALSLES